MRAINKQTKMTAGTIVKKLKQFLSTILPMLVVTGIMGLGTLPVSAHCDSYDGPTIKDAVKALETNNVNLVLKWIDKEQEQEVIELFNKTITLRHGDHEIYSIVEKYFLETLVRLHRETEGAPFTGLKPAGTTKAIVKLSDQALLENDIEMLLEKLTDHIGSVIREKYQKVIKLETVKENSPENGRKYVQAYVDYTHSLEAIHDMLEDGAGHAHAEHQQ